MKIVVYLAAAVAALAVPVYAQGTTVETGKENSVENNGGRSTNPAYPDKGETDASGEQSNTAPPQGTVGQPTTPAEKQMKEGPAAK